MILRISLLFVLAQLSSQQYFTTNGYQNVYNPDTNQYGRNVVNKLLTPYNMSGDVSAEFLSFLILSKKSCKHAFSFSRFFNFLSTLEKGFPKLAMNVLV